MPAPMANSRGRPRRVGTDGRSGLGAGGRYTSTAGAGVPLSSAVAGAGDAGRSQVGVARGGMVAGRGGATVAAGLPAVFNLPRTVGMEALTEARAVVSIGIVGRASAGVS